MNIRIHILLLILGFPLFAGPDHSYFEISFDKTNREIHFRDFINGDRHPIIRGPADYINCEKNVKRRIKGTLKFSDTQVAKNFPIFDRTTFKVWHTNQKGQFDIEFPGNCWLHIGTFNKRGIGTGFLTIKESENNFEQDIILPSQAFVMQIAEDIPDEYVKDQLFARFTLFSTWPPSKTPMTCINGPLPEKVLDFHPFVVNLDTNEFFEGFDYNDRFEVEFAKTNNFVFLAYANKPRKQVTIFIAQPAKEKPDLSGKHKNCIAISAQILKDFPYEALAELDIQKLSKYAAK